jgi:hypothetical protein
MVGWVAVATLVEVVATWTDTVLSKVQSQEIRIADSELNPQSFLFILLTFDLCLLIFDFSLALKLIAYKTDSSKTTASAIIPSSRPTNPIFSPVVALMFTSVGSI